MLLENKPKTVGFQSFLQLCPKALECLTTNSQGSRFLCDIPQTSHISPVFWLTLSADSLCAVTFHIFPRLFRSFYLFSFSFEKIISFSALNIQVSGIKRYRNGLDHDQHHHCYGYYQRKKKKKTSILTIGVLWQKTTKLLHHAEKRDVKMWLEKHLPFCAMCCYLCSCDTRKRGLGVWTREIA